MKRSASPEVVQRNRRGYLKAFFSAVAGAVIAGIIQAPRVSAAPDTRTEDANNAVYIEKLTAANLTVERTLKLKMASSDLT